MLMGNASKILQTVAANIDRDIFEVALQQLSDLVLLTDTTGMLTGEEDISVQGTNVAIQRETQRQRQLEFLQHTNNPVDVEIMGMKGRGAVLRSVSQTIGLDDEEVVPADDVLEQKEQQKADQTQQQALGQKVDQGIQMGVQQGVQKISSELTAGLLASQATPGGGAPGGQPGSPPGAAPPGGPLGGPMAAQAAQAQGNQPTPMSNQQTQPANVTGNQPQPPGPGGRPPPPGGGPG
jgi:hypothetical protein